MTTLLERFDAKTVPEPNTGCLLWTGARRGRAGYGQIDVDGRPESANRVAFYLRHNRWPNPWALHKCDTPACVNADHLFEGTGLDNMLDAVSKGRLLNTQKSLCPLGHAYDREVVRVKTGRTYRRCSECHRTQLRAWRSRNRVAK